VRQISGNTGSIDDIVKSELVNKWGVLDEEREGLSNTTSSTENNYLLKSTPH